MIKMSFLLYYHTKDFKSRYEPSFELNGVIVDEYICLDAGITPLRR
jgi:hypothetical protein